MDKIQNNFAAIAVMGQLYESGKDIYDVLASYLQVVIKSEKLNGFTCADITNRINKTNSFCISDSIVKTSLKRLGLTREHGVYTIEEGFYSTIDTTVLDEQTRQNRIVIDKLFSFISEEKKQILTEDEKSIIESQFYKYISDPDCDEEYSILISKFLLANSTDKSFYESLCRIKEGLLVYEGICFSPEIGSAGKWVIPLDIYLELEVLFYIEGFNGEIHQTLYGQLLDYAQEINNANKSQNNKTINLYYTSDVKSEIESYFSTAESIFDKNEIVDPSKSAMLHILDGVSSKSEIQIRKVQFINSLARKGIVEKEIDYYSEENIKYNIINGDVYQYNSEHINSDRGDEYIRRCSEKINQINIIRKNRNSSLKDARSILLTANSTILKCSFMPFALQEGEIPKAVNLDYLIARLWYKLGKGFGKGESPKSIDIISRAQMIIASMTVSKVSKTYDEIKQKYSDGLITDDQVAEIIVSLRNASINPEDITPEKIDEQIRFLTDYGLNSKLEDLKRKEIARQKDRDTIKELETKLIEAEKRRADENKERDEKERKLEKRIAELESINERVFKMAQAFESENLKRKLLAHKVLRGSLFILGIFIISGLLFVILKFLFNIDNSWSGVISIAITVAFQFIPPLKKLWKKQVINYKLKQK